MIPSIYEDIIQKLSEKTSKGEVEWAPTAKSNTYMVSFREFSLSIEYIHSDRNEDFVSFAIRDKDGKEIDTFFVSELENGWIDATNLYSFSRRKALRIDKAIEKISEELDKPGLVGSKRAVIKDDVPF